MQPKKNGTSNDWLRSAKSKGRMRRSTQSVKSSESYDGCLGGLRHTRRRTVTHYVLSALRPSGAGLVLSASSAFYFSTVQYLKLNIDLHHRVCQDRDTMSSDTVSVSKVKREDERSSLHVRVTPQHHHKLAMLVRETGRSRRDIVEMLIDMAKVGEYTE